MLPFPPAPAPEIRYPRSGLTKNTKNTFSMEPTGNPGFGSLVTGPSSSTSKLPSLFSLVTTRYTSAWFIVDLLDTKTAANTVSENPLQNRLITITATKKKLPKVCFTSFIISLHSSVRFISYRVLITLKCLLLI